MTRPLIEERGLIPAWAGKTPGLARRRGYTPAHPRVGGENEHEIPGRETPVGSSPRGRGKRGPGRGGGGGWGLIPAWAGKTTPPSRSKDPCRAHPRVGGENDIDHAVFEDYEGSSPRGRGKPGALPADCHGIGLIPAWAGKTRD